MRFIVVVLSLISILASCKEKPAAPVQTVKEEAEKVMSRDIPSVESIIKKPNYNENVLDVEKITSENSKWTFLTRGFFFKNIEVNGSDVVKHSDDGSETIKFNDNHTYWKKKDKVIVEEGVWQYDNDTEKILMQNLSPEGRNSEWTIKPGNDNLIFVGTSRYGNNATQIRYTRGVE